VSNFLDIGAEHINLDRVVRIVQIYPNGIKGPRPEVMTTFYFSDNDYVSTERYLDENDFRNIQAIPAAPGAYVLTLHPCARGEDGSWIDARPTEVEVLKHVVVGWTHMPWPRSEFRVALPIFLESCADDSWYYPLPDGEYLSAESTRYDSLEDLTSDVLQDAQHEWDKKHG